MYYFFVIFIIYLFIFISIQSKGSFNINKGFFGHSFLFLKHKSCCVQPLIQSLREEDGLCYYKQK